MKKSAKPQIWTDAKQRDSPKDSKIKSADVNHQHPKHKSEKISRDSNLAVKVGYNGNTNR